ncbi:hypothetical protein DRO53_03125 [Candidatus Bathyarchaeota archaeon]|nr:MAG: hypothetical protein DRO53_03125 [Candidatus Bathyarchaeota archaeon]
MAEKFGKRELEDVIWGATLLGAGGGGSPKNGLKLLEDLLKASPEGVTLISPEEFGSEEYAVMVAGIGSPKVLMEKGFGPEAIYAFEAISSLQALAGKRITHLYPGELGGFNVMPPFYVAALKGMPVVDADGCGRAVPELETTLFYLYGIPSSPCAMADSQGNIVIFYTRNPMDSTMAENLARHVSTAFGMGAAFATWVVNGEELRRALALNTVTLCRRVGAAIREAKERGGDPVRAAVEAVGGVELFRGKVADISTRTVEGFDFGRFKLEGVGGYQGKTLTVEFKNENMVVWSGEGEALATVPDLICTMTLNGTPLTNADMEVGMEIAVIAASASEKWRKHPEGFKVWKHILEKMGYTGDYVPVK